MMLTRRSAIAACASLPLLVPSARAQTNLRVVGNRLFVAARVNGRPVTALLDSGAESSIIDTDFARSLGLAGGRQVKMRGSGGDTSTALAEGVRIEALGQQLGPLTVAVLDLSDVGRRLLHAPLPVIVGREMFDAARWAIDIEGGQMHRLPQSAKPPGTHLRLTTLRGIETFPASVEGRAPVQAVFDLGNGSDVMIGARYAARIGALRDGRAVAMKRGGGIGGATDRRMVMLRRIEIAGHAFADVPAAIDATGSAADLNIGVAILRQFRIVTDFAHHAVWLRA